MTRGTRTMGPPRMARASNLLIGPTLGATLALARDLIQENKQRGARPVAVRHAIRPVLVRKPDGTTLRRYAAY